MQRRLDMLLRQQGYQFLKVNPPEAGVYYKIVGTTVRVILGINYHDEFQIDATAHRKMKRMLQETFLYPSEHGLEMLKNAAVTQVEIFTVIVTPKPERAKLLSEADDACWILDIANKRLLIYENQRSDFYGLNGLMQQLLEAENGLQTSGTVSNRAGEQGHTPGRNRPKSMINICLVLMNIVIFVGLTMMGDTSDAYFMSQHGAMYPDFVLIEHRWYLLFTNMFVHFGFEHLLNNMIILLCVGEYLERWLGKVKYLILYFVAGIGGSLLSLAEMMMTGEYAVSGGASGAIFGVIGGLLWVIIRNKGKVENLSTRGIIIMIVLSLYFGFASTGVDNSAHIGGLIVGFVMSIILYRKKPKVDFTS